MAKGKNKGGNGNGNGNGGEGDNKNDTNKNGDGDGHGNGNEYLNIVLKVDFHCDGCTKKIRSFIQSFPGVCTVELEGGKNVKIVALKKTDAEKLRKNLAEKMVKNVELVSPKPAKKDDQKKDEKKDKPKELAITTVVMKIPYHCFGCGEKTRKAVSSYKGVIEVKIEKEKDLVTVKGKVDGKKMVEELKKKLKKSVELVPEKKNQKDKKDDAGGENAGNEKKQENSGGGEKTVKIDHFSYVHGYYGVGPMLYPPQLFSDENPNACSIM